MSATKVTTDVIHVGATMQTVLNQLAEKNPKLVATKMQGIGRRFRNASLSFYFTVLRVRTGALRKSFKEFARQSGTDSMEYGMMSDMNYAHIQHEGFDGMEKVKAHARKGGKYGYFAVRAHDRHMNIKAKHFFSIPMINVTNEVIDELKKEIDF